MVLENAVVAEALRARDAAADRLLRVSFVSVHDYLHLFRALTLALGAAGTSGMVYSAAAVSDFFVPESKMATHKIQSQGGGAGLQLALDPVPKLLGMLRTWCPRAFTVTFKLETDEGILERKVVSSLQSYKQRAVVANLLHSHRDCVTLYFAEGPIKVVRRTGELLEADFVPLLCERHAAHIDSQ